MPSTTSWFSWIQFEQFAAIHDIPYATEENGFKGLGAELLINKAPFVGHLNRLLEMSKEGLFKYTGRDNAPDPIFSSGQATMSFNSSGSRSEIAKNAKFKWREALLPYDPALIKQPINSVIGGASLWAMTAPNRSCRRVQGRRAVPEVPLRAQAGRVSGARRPATCRSPPAATTCSSRKATTPTTRVPTCRSSNSAAAR